jgi:hypothetical protein
MSRAQTQSARDATNLYSTRGRCRDTTYSCLDVNIQADAQLYVVGSFNSSCRCQREPALPEYVTPQVFCCSGRLLLEEKSCYREGTGPEVNEMPFSASPRQRAGLCVCAVAECGLKVMLSPLVVFIRLSRQVGPMAW